MLHSDVTGCLIMSKSVVAFDIFMCIIKIGLRVVLVLLNEAALPR
jgi:hypothetical protein